MSLRLVPIDLKHAKEFIERHHRHNEPPVGWKIGVGVADGETLVGVAVLGRPTAAAVQQSWGYVLEVKRTATDGTRNANSMLLGACRRLAFSLGYDRLITYTQADESGASLRAAGFKVLAERKPRGSWNTPSRPREEKAHGVARTLWEAS